MRKLATIQKIRKKILWIFNIVEVDCDWGIQNGYKLKFIKQKKETHSIDLCSVEKYYKGGGVSELLNFSRCITLDILNFLIEYKPKKLIIYYNFKNKKSTKLVFAYLTGFKCIIHNYKIEFDLNSIILKIKENEKK